jgi:alkanesulfonate monooxygenase SsuD/methylene tetrahydromethanopterin reductase-like flavin-dependent oxidoreductase (luciferase family)
VGSTLARRPTRALTTTTTGAPCRADHSRGYSRTGIPLADRVGARGLTGRAAPEHVVERFREIADAGIDGLTVSGFNYDPGIETFRTRILPLMVEAGLRVDGSATAAASS